MLGMGFDKAVDFSRPAGSHPKQVFGKALHVATNVLSLTPKRFPDLAGILLPHISLKKHLQG
jgi:hypothetical protein